MEASHISPSSEHSCLQSIFSLPSRYSAHSLRHHRHRGSTTRLLLLLHNVRYRILGKHKVIRMAESNHITRRHSDTLIDSLTLTMVWLRDKLHMILIIGDSLTDKLSKMIINAMLSIEIAQSQTYQTYLKPT